MKSEQSIKKINNGDFIILGKMLGIKPDAARMRYRRSNPDALLAMSRISEMKEKLISENTK